MNAKNFWCTIMVLFFVHQLAFSQDDLLDLLGNEETTTYATAAFKSSRVVNGQSIENVAKGVLDIKIQHRFAAINRGINDLFGLDGATIRLGGDYGVTDRITVGFGRSTLDKTLDGFVKYKILRQSSGKRNMPISLSWFSSIDLKTIPFSDPERDNVYSSRISYAHQLIIARKFSDNFTVQLMPTIVHRNLVATKAEANDVISIGAALRQKITKRLAVNIEYYYVLPDQLAAGFQDALGIGFDIETGGHVFQLHFSNANSLVYSGFIGESVDRWDKGTIHFGFNLARVFTLVKSRYSK